MTTKQEHIDVVMDLNLTDVIHVATAAAIFGEMINDAADMFDFAAFTCSEVDALVDLLNSLGHDNAAGMVLDSHSEGDDMGDSHYRWDHKADDDPIDPPLEPGKITYLNKAKDDLEEVEILHYEGNGVYIAKKSDGSQVALWLNGTDFDIIKEQS